MKHIKVTWKHFEPNDPTYIYSELDDDQWEQRKIEIFSGGRRGFADETREMGGTFLGEKPWPDLDLMRNESEFTIKEISESEFEAIWIETIRSET